MVLKLIMKTHHVKHLYQRNTLINFGQLDYITIIIINLNRYNIVNCNNNKKKEETDSKKKRHIN